MSREEWLQQALEDAPPLTDAQLAALRPVCLRMAGRMNGNAAPACPQEPRPGVTTPEKNTA